MRTAPVALVVSGDSIESIDLEAAQIAASTHGNSLGYMPAAMLTHIINRIVFPPDGRKIFDVYERFRYEKDFDPAGDVFANGE